MIWCHTVVWMQEMIQYSFLGFLLVGNSCQCHCVRLEVRKSIFTWQLIFVSMIGLKASSWFVEIVVGVYHKTTNVINVVYSSIFMICILVKIVSGSHYSDYVLIDCRVRHDGGSRESRPLGWLYDYGKWLVNGYGKLCTKRNKNVYTFLTCFCYWQ